MVSGRCWSVQRTSTLLGHVAAIAGTLRLLRRIEHGVPGPRGLRRHLLRGDLAVEPLVQDRTDRGVPLRKVLDDAEAAGLLVGLLGQQVELQLETWRRAVQVERPVSGLLVYGRRPTGLRHDRLTTLTGHPHGKLRRRLNAAALLGRLQHDVPL